METRPPYAPAIRLAGVALALAMIAAAIWFRVAGTLAEPLWLDEAYSAYAAGKGFDFLWHVVPRYETHPPFYYSLLRVWTLGFGDTLLALRALGMVCGVATLPVMMLAARELARLTGQDRQGGAMMLAVLALAGFSPMFVEMTREARPYPVLILVYAVALWALLRVARRAALERRIARRPFALYVVCLALVLWLHNLGPLYGAALGLAFLALMAGRGLAPRDWGLIVGGHLLAGLAWLPALLILIDQAPTWVQSTWLKFTTFGLINRLGLIYAAPGWDAEIASALLALFGLAALARHREGRRAALALILLAGVPVALSLALSVLVAPVFITRTMTAAGAASLVLLAAGAAGQRGAWRFPAVAALLFVVVQMMTMDMRARRGGPAQDWYGTVRWVAARHRPGDQIWAYPNEGALPFDYAVRDLGLALPTRPIPTAVPSLKDGGWGSEGSWNPTGSRGVVSLPPARLHALAQSPESRAIPTIWLFRLGANAYDKGDVLLDALRTGRVQVARFRKGPIDVIGLRRADLAIESGRNPQPFVSSAVETKRKLPPVAPAQQAQP